MPRHVRFCPQCNSLTDFEPYFQEYVCRKCGWESDDEVRATGASKKMLQKALNIAIEAHKNQTDKGGNPYINHPVFLALQRNTDAEKIVALLHDVAEDSKWDIEALRKEGFSEPILKAVSLLTHNKNVPYYDYIRAIKNDLLARAVKIADLQHNSDLSRIPSPTQKDLERVERYKEALKILE